MIFGYKLKCDGQLQSLRYGHGILYIIIIIYKASVYIFYNILWFELSLVQPFVSSVVVSTHYHLSIYAKKHGSVIST